MKCIKRRMMLFLAAALWVVCLSLPYKAFHGVNTMAAAVNATSLPSDENSPPDTKEPRSYLRDITRAVGYMADFHLSKVLFSGDRMLIAWSGNPVASGNTAFFTGSLAGESTPVLLFSLGIDSLLAKNDGVWNSYPQLVAWLNKDRCIINLHCSAKFPHRGGTVWDTTGNVVLYNMRTRQYTNLIQRMPHSKLMYNEAIKWFADSHILLVEESEIASSAEPSPVPGTAKPFCLSLNGERHPLHRFPEVERWYAEHRKPHLEFTLETMGRRINYDTCTITSEPPRRSITFHHILYGKDFHLFRINRNLVCVSNPALGGTWLADFDGTMRMRISTAIAIDYDDETKQLVLRSTAHDDDGQYRYWLFSFPKYWEQVEKAMHLHSPD